MDILPIKIKLETIVPNLPAFGNQHTVLSDIETVVISNIGVHNPHRTAERGKTFLRQKAPYRFQTAFLPVRKPSPSSQTLKNPL
ncbi:hypothetical protein [Neisseria cinerea]|uniref:hypothetical protein n=1 Tax=Neisseria cinerea TaxID=483 RepID=UPI00131B8047|nr:hypothetical protein [Neisseria cinerea]